MSERHNVPVRNERALFVYALFSSVFCAVLIMGVALGSKIVVVGGITASVSALTYPITFIITDIINEALGPRAARRIVIFGAISLVTFFLLIELALALPAAPFWENAEGYQNAFGLSLRIIAAGTVAYIISQLHDVWLFHVIRSVTGERALWLRKSLSTVVSQAIDSAIFVFVAFWGVAPLWELFLGQFIIKAAIALLDTPFVYAGAAWLERVNGGTGPTYATGADATAAA